MASMSHNIAFVGTLQSNKRDIPIEVKNVAERENVFLVNAFGSRRKTS